MNNVLDPMAERFLRYLRVERNDSPNTILNYKDDLIAFSVFLSGRGKATWLEVSLLDIRSYLAQLHREEKARRTIARRISSLRSFYRYLMREGLTDKNPFTKVKTPKLEKKLAGCFVGVEIESRVVVPVI